jgi:hypothetical protein
VRKSALAFAFLIMIAAVLVSLSFNVRAVDAASPSYSLANVTHTIRIMDNGYVLVNDTVRILGNASSNDATLENFLLGFPYKYGQYIVGCTAYEASRTFNVMLDVPLENRMGFYGVEVTFPQPLNVSNGAKNAFNVVTVLSNDLITQYSGNSSIYTLDFPEYPGLTETAAVCNVSIPLPLGAEYLVGTVGGFTYGTENLPPFTSSPANVTFLLHGNKIQIFDISGLSRKISVNEFGGLEGSDTYRIRNKAPFPLNSTELVLPLNASQPTAIDLFGRTLTSPDLVDVKTNRYTVTFTSPVESNTSSMLTLKYSFPTDVYCTKQPGMTNGFNIVFPSFQCTTYYIDQASVTFIFPEGARILSFNKTLIGNDYSITNSVFQQTLTVSRQGFISLDTFDVGIAYEYNPLWLSYHPALYMWALAIVACAVVVVLRGNKAPIRVVAPVTGARLRSDDIRSFINAYEEKMKINSEIDSLEGRVQKGKIPRRQYKVQRRILETRLNTLSKSLTEFKGRMHSAGGHYAEMMRTIEIAETDINEAETSIKSIETRHGKGELSLEAYRKLLSDYQRRKERADTAINGVLLRLREEIR